MKKSRLLAGASESMVITGMPAAIALSMLSLSSAESVTPTRMPVAFFCTA
jgi:hypothetical protein